MHIYNHVIVDFRGNSGDAMKAPAKAGREYRMKEP